MAFSGVAILRLCRYNLVFCHEFGNREIKKNCCRSRTNCIRCWRHYLKHVNLEQLGTNCRDTLKQCQQLNFYMKWVKHKKAKVSYPKEKEKVAGIGGAAPGHNDQTSHICFMFRLARTQQG